MVPRPDHQHARRNSTTTPPRWYWIIKQHKLSTTSLLHAHMEEKYTLLARTECQVKHKNNWIFQVRPFHILTKSKMPIPLSWETLLCIRVCRATHPMGERVSFSMMEPNGKLRTSTAQVGFNVQNSGWRNVFSILSIWLNPDLYFLYSIED